MKINFSHEYDKLHFYNSTGYKGNIEKADLIEVLNIDLENLSKEFLDYDTNFGEYKLPKKGKYMILLFQKSASDIFTTIRRWTPEKEKYYRSAIGKEFDICIS